jgi:1-deoxy-D-xylulose-5-phosphate synthase
MLASGFGSAVAEAALTRWRAGAEVNRLCLLGLPDRFIDHGERAEQLAEGRLDAETLTRRILLRLPATRRPEAS